MKYRKPEELKRIAKDMTINLVGTGISLVILQLFIYPLVAKLIDGNTYGEMQSCISLVYLIAGTLGTALSTTRLLCEYHYREKGIIADFNLLNVFNISAIIVVFPIALYFHMSEPDAVSIILITFIALLNCIVNYFSVGFRLRLDYRAILIQKIITCLGYILGFFIFYFIRRWEIVFITSFLLEAVYCIFSTKLFYEPYKKSLLMKQTLKDYGSLLTSRFTGSALTYFDKLILYPLLGGEALSIYFAANVLGKLIIMAIEPITNVVLSYLSKVKTISVKLWNIVIPVALGVCGLMYFVCLVISKPILFLLYPQWAELALPLVPWTTLSLAVAAFIHIISPFTLKTLPTHNQIIFNVSGLVAYIPVVMILFKQHGMIGCCIALLISHIVKLVLMLILSIRRYYGKKS